MTVSPPDPAGVRLQRLLRAHGMMGLFSYAAHQRLAAAADGPALRTVLTDLGWNAWPKPADAGILGAFARRLEARGWTEPRRPDPLAAAVPSDGALEAALDDLRIQAQRSADE